MAKAWRTYIRYRAPSMGKAPLAGRPPAQMKTAWDCYDAGDVTTARRLAHEVLRAPQGQKEAEEAKELLARTRLPRQVFVIVVCALALLVFLWFLALHRGAWPR